jgi:ABC-type transporter Mla subunit MlaD
MADKKIAPLNQNENDLSTSSELESLRTIVFGAAKAEIDERLNQLEQTMLSHFEQAEKNLTKQVEQIQSSLNQAVVKLNDKIGTVDHQQDERSNELKMYADKLASELEMSDTSGKQDSDELHSRLDKEVQALTEKYDAKLAEALQKLNQVTQELGSSKTDRKTLAKLLATVASNLETDQE